MDNYSVPAPPMNPAQSMQQPNLSAGGPTGLLAGMLWKDQYDKYNQQQDVSQQMRLAELYNYQQGQSARDNQSNFNSNYYKTATPQAGDWASSNLDHLKSTTTMNNSQAGSTSAQTQKTLHDLSADYAARAGWGDYNEYATPDENGVYRLPKEKQKALGENFIKTGQAQRLYDQMKLSFGNTYPAVAALKAALNNPNAMGAYIHGAIADNKARDTTQQGVVLGAQKVRHAEVQGANQFALGAQRGEYMLQKQAADLAAKEALIKLREDKLTVSQGLTKLVMKEGSGTPLTPAEKKAKADLTAVMAQIDAKITQAKIQSAQGSAIGLPSPDLSGIQQPSASQPAAGPQTIMKFDAKGNPI